MSRRFQRFAAGAVGAAVWIIPLVIAVVAMAVRGPLTIYSAAPPPRAELVAYADAHKGLYPSLPDTIKATYITFDEDGLNFFHQAAPRFVKLSDGAMPYFAF